MNTLYFYKSFLKKVRSHLGELAGLTGPVHLHMNSPLVVTFSRLLGAPTILNQKIFVSFWKVFLYKFVQKSFRFGFVKKSFYPQFYSSLGNKVFYQNHGHTFALYYVISTSVKFDANIIRFT